MQNNNHNRLMEITESGCEQYQASYASAFSHYDDLLRTKGLEEASCWRCQTDLLFLGRVLGYDKILDRVHGPVADLCVKKNPMLPIEEQDAVKERMHLDPRGTFKSTLSIIDSVQYIVCFPEVRICKLTATKPLAAAIAGEITGHFVGHDDLTLFQELFSDFLIRPRDILIGQFTAPNRKRDWREATVMSFSIETSISGWHFDVLDPDDVVDTVNSSTPGGIAKVKKNFRINRKTLMPWGYINFKGTRYNPFDLWGDIIEKARPGKIKLLIRSALKLKSGQRLEPSMWPDHFPAESEVEVLFPELLSYEFLKDQFEDDYSSFMTQYMNDAYGGEQVVFPREAMLQATLPHKDMPIAGETFIFWRFAYDSKPNMRYAAAAVGIIANGRMFIVDVLRGSFKPSDLAMRVIQLAKKWGVRNVDIEETPGARYYESPILNYGITLGWSVTVRWTEYQEDEGARSLRMKYAEPLITAMRLLFSDGIVCLNEVFRQFCNFGMVEDSEIPDVVSRVAENLPKSIALKDDKEQDIAWELVKQRDLYDRTHGLGKYAPQEPTAEEKPYQPEPNSYGLDEVMPGLNG